MNKQIQCQALLDEIHNHSVQLDSQHETQCWFDAKPISNEGHLYIQMDGIDVVDRRMPLNDSASLQAALRQIQTFITLPSDSAHKDVDSFVGGA